MMIRRNMSKLRKDLPIHVACLTGDKTSLKTIVSSVQRQLLEVKDSLGRTPLILSVTGNHVECGAVLLKCGVTVDNTDNAGQTALHIAASKGFHHFVRLLLAYKASWMQRDYFGATALHMAAINPNVKCLLAILKYVKPAEIDIQDTTLKTALHWAAAYAYSENIKVLLGQGANICIPDEDGKTPLHWAVAVNSNLAALECVKTLLKKELCLVNWQDYQGRSGLHIAVNCGSEEMLYFLASRENCNIDLLDNSFCTPLHCAAKKGLSEKADILLKKRASHLSADDNGATPLHYAVHNNHHDTVKVFISKSFINDDHPDLYGRSALMWAAIKGSEAAVKTLAAYSKLDLSNVDKNGFNALHAAAICGHVGILRILLDLGLSVDIRDNHGMTPFLKACEFGRSNSAQVLLDCGANMEAKDNDECSALHWCARGGSAYLSQILIRRGGAEYDCNIRDSFRMTPLHYASVAGDFINCTCILVESGADPNAEDFEGKTPLHSSVLCGRVGITRYLCEHGADVNAMFQKDDWVTPLDCAIMSGKKELFFMLKRYGALHAKDIKELAAVTIQKWYIKLKSQTLKIGKNSCSTSYSLYFDSSLPFSSVKHKKCIPLSEVPQNYIQSSIYSRSYHICNGCFHKIVCFHVCEKDQNHHSLEENKAASIIQRSWRRYISKTNFFRMRKEVAKAFPNEKERLFAEELWKCRLNSFYLQLKE